VVYGVSYTLVLFGAKALSECDPKKSMIYLDPRKNEDSLTPYGFSLYRMTSEI